MSEELLNERLNAAEPARYDDPQYPIQKIAIGQKQEEGETGVPQAITYIDHATADVRSGLTDSTKIGEGSLPSGGTFYVSNQILSSDVSGEQETRYFWDKNGRLIAGSCNYNASVADAKIGMAEGTGKEGNALLAKTTATGAGTDIVDAQATTSWGSPTDHTLSTPGQMLNMTRWTLQVNAADDTHGVEDTGKYIEFDDIAPQPSVDFKKLPMGYYGNIEGFTSDGMESTVSNENMAKIEITGLEASKIASGTTYFGVKGTFIGRLGTLDNVTQYFDKDQQLTPTPGGDVDGWSEVDVNATLITEDHPGNVYTYYIGEFGPLTP